MQTDIEHFRSKLSKIDGASSLGEKLLQLVLAKPIAAASTEAEKSDNSIDKTDEVLDSKSVDS